MHFKEQFLAMQAAQDRAEFERVLAAQKEIIKAEEEKQKSDKVSHVLELTSFGSPRVTGAEDCQQGGGAGTDQDQGV